MSSSMVLLRRKPFPSALGAALVRAQPPSVEDDGAEGALLRAHAGLRAMLVAHRGRWALLGTPPSVALAAPAHRGHHPHRPVLFLKPSRVRATAPVPSSAQAPDRMPGFSKYMQRRARSVSEASPACAHDPQALRLLLRVLAEEDPAPARPPQLSNYSPVLVAEAMRYLTLARS